ncbi:hypothetical protein PYJP_15400 [Pyrofollis japonicus]|nr:hypothetical protein PYJP_15400 [Pyrofollis japonicus]
MDLLADREEAKEEKEAVASQDLCHFQMEGAIHYARISVVSRTP